MNALSLKNLKKTYNDGTKALHGISFNVEKGDFFALLGPNGAGKTTAIGIITSLVNKTSGTIKIFGKEIIDAKKDIGVVPQEFNFAMFETVEQILLTQAGYYGVKRSIAIPIANELMKKSDLYNKKDTQARFLSGGMKRRLMIARALMHKPKLLILDEPTAGVDIEIRRSMWEMFQELNKNGTTIILTTHYLEEAESMCKNIAIIDKGRIVENTSMKKLLAKQQNETFVLELENDVKNLPKTSFNLKLIDETTIEAEVNKKKTINKLFEELTKEGIKVCGLRNKTNRLEELFMRLTKHAESKDSGVSNFRRNLL